MTLVAVARRRFAADTAEHEMTVLRDDGLYRHLRFNPPGSWTYGYELVTWPGYLAIVGDAGDYVFARIEDMFKFFGPQGARGGFEDEEWGINPGYWSEKLQGRPDFAQVYSHDAFKARLYEWADAEADWSDVYPSLLRGAVDRELLHSYTFSDAEARERMDDVDDDGTLFSGWEWDLRDYESRFLWCCWAIVWGIGRYRAATEGSPK